MPLPPRKPVPGKPAGKPPTTRGPVKPPTGRAPATPAALPEKSKMPLILGIAGGAIFLIIIVVILFSGDDPKAKAVAEKTKAPKEDFPKPVVPDVSALENEGKSKCRAGVEKITPRLGFPDPSVPKDRLRADLEEGLKLMKAGLAAYDKAVKLAGKKYDLADFYRTQKKAIDLYCTDLEKEGQSSCEEGLKIIMSTKEQISDVSKLSDEEKTKLLETLRRGQKLIQEGMGQFDKSYEVSDRRFETTPYQEALKIARLKIPELK
jgi:hypothetical protein